jgi:hypothetical protein
MTVTIVDAARPVTGGADAHLDFNVRREEALFSSHAL